MVKGTANKELRKFRRVSVDFPVTYRLKGRAYLGKAVDACNEGMMVESLLGLNQALRLFHLLAAKEEGKVELKFTTNDRAYRAEGEMKHFRLCFFGRQPFRAELGLFLPRIEVESAKIDKPTVEEKN
jgi:hypothetical protein